MSLKDFGSQSVLHALTGTIDPSLTDVGCLLGYVLLLLVADTKKLLKEKDAGTLPVGHSIVVIHRLIEVG